MKTLSKLLLSATLLTTPVILQAQTNTSEKIKQVENGLFGRVQIAGEKPWNLAERLAYNKIPSVSIAVIQNHSLVWAKEYGFANESSKAPVATQTLFQAGSIKRAR